MNIFKLIAGVIGVATAAGGYMSFKYSTTSSCEAAKTAIVLESPKIIEELGEEDARFRAVQAGATLLGGNDIVETVMTKVASDEVEDKSALECVYMVAHREISPSGFRKSVAEEMKDRIAAAL